MKADSLQPGYQQRIQDLEAISARHSAEAARWEKEARQERRLSQQAQSELRDMLRGLTLCTRHSMLANSDEFKAAQAYLREYDAAAAGEVQLPPRRQGIWQRLVARMRPTSQ